MDYTGFAKCSELKHKATLRKYYEGGSARPHTSLSREECEPITLEQGLTRDVEMLRLWHTRHQKKNFSIVPVDFNGLHVVRFNCYGGLVHEFSIDAWDAGSDEIQIAKLVVAIDHFDVQPVPNNSTPILL